MESQTDTSKPVLEVEGLKVQFRTRDGLVKAVRDITFKLFPGENLGIVGESGCGKSVTALSILRLIQCPPGNIEANRITFNGTDLLHSSEREMRKVRGNHISMIFQDPMTSLNPVLTIGKQMSEVIELHMGLKGKDLRSRCIELLQMVGISAPEMRLKSYPHQLSGGMRQRVMIAMAISCHPSILLADEPTTALDVTIQDQILRLLLSLSRDLHMATILITHNFGAVAGTTNRIIVMYAGEIVEMASSMELFHNPLHPYTIGLLQSIPRVYEEEQARLYSIKGRLPSPINLPKGCCYAPRCEYAFDTCMNLYPTLEERESDHYVSCWKVL
ncbi:MAG: ABC transporter ATP-binding protein [Deltaproteobacteria bacterium]|nr:ABC transporter ATP-binding protein [Deltaproteobacteria bacterium]MBW2053396.1 ABC transporter ATP-binding protein [Deltaproteobacteria bacterium]MBW2139515.1 ABC transporter ATP-binding protein [Deltaproteobacteria bacterium]MBW2322537.1 ABC transporter ATP-binding protein [Deltaproteobacteria bacterium]